jgi:hypothetical protein
MVDMNNLTVPFILSDHTALLKNVYPNAEDIKNVFTKSNESERHGIIRLWITEGIPFAFKDNPLLYEEMRAFIARGVNVNPKEITLVGSARIGYSLKKKVWGKDFTNKSDLDFTIISNDLFKNLISDFQKWAGDITSRKILPKTKEQNQNWLNSIVTINENIPKGYINTKNLFSHPNYPTVKNCYRTMTKLKERLEVTENSPSISDASIRVYSNWKTCTRQLEINFKTALDLWK